MHQEIFLEGAKPT